MCCKNAQCFAFSKVIVTASFYMWVEAGVGLESDSEDEEEDSLEDIIDKTQQTRITPVIASNNNIAATVIKRIPTISESSDASMLSLGDDDGEENET